jgi:putative protease
VGVARFPRRPAEPRKGDRDHGCPEANHEQAGRRARKVEGEQALAPQDGPQEDGPQEDRAAQEGDPEEGRAEAGSAKEGRAQEDRAPQDGPQEDDAAQARAQEEGAAQEERRPQDQAEEGRPQEARQEEGGATQGDGEEDRAAHDGPQEGGVAPASGATQGDRKEVDAQASDAKGERSSGGRPGRDGGPSHGARGAGPQAGGEAAPFSTERRPARPGSTPSLGTDTAGAGGASASGPAAPSGSPAERTSVAAGEAAVADSLPQRIGVVTHYYPHVHACVVAVEQGELRVGDTVHIRGHTTDYYQRVDRIELDHDAIETARPGQAVGLHVAQRVREHDVVYRLTR